MATDKPIWNYLLPLIVFFILASMWYRGDGSLFQGVKDTFGFLYETFVPDVSVGERSLKAASTAVAGEVLDTGSSLKKVLESLASEKSGKNCFTKYAPLTTDLGDDTGSASFLFNYDETHDQTHVVVYKHKDVVASQFDVKGLRLCVIAGEEGNTYVAQNFYNTISRSTVDFGAAQMPYVWDVDTLSISYSQNGRHGNVIRLLKLPHDKTLSDDVVNDESKNFEEGGLIFKGPDNEVCFFPTNWVSNADEDGLDNDIVQELGTRFDQGDGLPRCNVESGFEAITVSGTMDASSRELDCVDLYGNPITETTRRVQVAAHHPFVKNVRSSCGQYLPKTLLPLGCMAVLDSRERTVADGNACGVTVVQSGEVIPTAVSQSGLVPFTSAAFYEETSAQCLISQGEWFSSDQSSLLCAKNVWKQCDSNTAGEKIDVPIDLTGPVVSFVCDYDGSWGNWVRSGAAPWQVYRGVEIYGTDGASSLSGFPYPSLCDAERNGAGEGTVYSLCDIKGRMGVSNPSFTKSSFVCPSQSLDCGDETEFPAMDSLVDSGCQVFLSGEKTGIHVSYSNVCGRSVVPFGTIISRSDVDSSTPSLYHCDSRTSEYECAAGPVEGLSYSHDLEDQWVGCLLTQRTVLPAFMQGDVLCGKTADAKGAWYLCDSRVENQCVDVPRSDGDSSTSSQFCCKFNKGENIYHFIDTPKVG